MDININRHHYSKYGIDGTLSINDQYVCDTCEHPDRHIAAGHYDVCIAHNGELRRKVPYLISCEASGNGALPPFLRIGNGPFKLRDGSIIVGKHHITGVLINSAKCFNRIIDRLDKAQSRKEKIELHIKG